MQNSNDRRDDEARLEGWGPIANYLRVSISTAQRWEANLGLPIHRLSKERRATPYALVSELRAWREGRERAPEGSGIEGASAVIHTTLEDVAGPASGPAVRPVSATDETRSTLVGARSEGSRALALVLMATVALIATAIGGFGTSDSLGKRASPSINRTIAVTILSDNPELWFGALAVDERTAYVATKVYTHDGNDYVAAVALASGPARKLYDPKPQPDNVTGVALVGDDVYWGDAESGALTDSEIWRAPKNGNGTPEVIYRGAASGQQLVDVWSLASDGTRLYVADAFQGRVLAVEGDSGKVAQIGPMRYGGGLVILSRIYTYGEAWR